MWGKVSCLRKQHDGRDWASNHRPSDLNSNTLTTTPQTWPNRDSQICSQDENLHFLVNPFDWAFNFKNWSLGRQVNCLKHRLKI